LSSILNLSDHCSQDKLFTKDDWDDLNAMYKEKYKAVEECPNPAVTLHWYVAIMVALHLLNHKEKCC
jgi:hypothetical protein